VNGVPAAVSCIEAAKLCLHQQLVFSVLVEGLVDNIAYLTQVHIKNVIHNQTSQTCLLCSRAAGAVGALS
jgi:hypothetical protein